MEKKKTAVNEMAICITSLCQAVNLAGGRITTGVMEMSVGDFIDMISRNGIEFKFTGYHRRFE